MKTKEELRKEFSKAIGSFENDLVASIAERCVSICDQETASLREQLKEKEEEILFTDLELNQKVSLLRSCETALEEKDKEVEHWKIEFNQQSDLNASLVIENTKQSTLIESLAGAMDKVKPFIGVDFNIVNTEDYDSAIEEFYKVKDEYNNYKNKQDGK